MKTSFLIGSFICLGSLMVSAQDIAIMDGSVNYLKKGEALESRGALLKAAEVYEKGLESDQTQNSEYKMRLANIHRQLNNYDQAESYYSQVISHSSTDDDKFYYAEVLAANSKYDEAEKWYNDLAVKSEVSTVRSNGFAQVEMFKSDSMAYSVSAVNFNSNQSDFFVSKLDDKLVFVSSRDRKSFFSPKDLKDETDFYDFYEIKDGEVTPIEGLNNVLNQGPFTFVPQSGEYLITENYPLSSKNSDRDKAVQLRINRYKMVEGEWKMQGTLPFCKDSYSAAHPTFDSKNQRLYFVSDMPGGIGGDDIYYSDLKDGDWSEPKLMNGINTTADELFPFIDASNQELYFSSNGFAGLGGLDIYKVNLADLSKVVNLGYPINSSKDDFAFVLNENSKKGFLSSNREGGIGKDDIYEFSIFKIKIRSKMLNPENQPLTGKMKVIEKSTGREIPYTVNAAGEIAFDGIEGQEYVIKAEKEGYGSTEQLIKADPKMNNELVNLILKPLEEEKPEIWTDLIVVNNGKENKYYALIDHKKLTELKSAEGKWSATMNIKSVLFELNSKEIVVGNESLDQLANFLLENSAVVLEAKTYADSRGTGIYNKRLTEKRAEAIKDYLAKKGVSKDQMKIVGMGEENLLNGCDDNKECSDEQHAVNRRMELSLKSK